MHVVTKCFAIMYALMPIKITDPSPGIFEHFPSIFSFENLGLHADTHRYCITEGGHSGSIIVAMSSGLTFNYLNTM